MSNIVQTIGVERICGCKAFLVSTIWRTVLLPLFIRSSMILELNLISLCRTTSNELCFVMRLWHVSQLLEFFLNVSDNVRGSQAYVTFLWLRTICLCLDEKWRWNLLSSCIVNNMEAKFQTKNVLFFWWLASSKHILRFSICFRRYLLQA